MKKVVIDFIIILILTTYFSTDISAKVGTVYVRKI